MPEVAQFFTRHDYTLSLPMIMLTVFALGILIVDLMLPREWKVANAWTAFIGLCFALAATLRVHMLANDFGPSFNPFAFSGTFAMDRFTIFFTYLFLLAAAITIFMSARYLEIEGEHHGEYYALILFSVVGMICMAGGIDFVLQFIGLELMAISTYILVGFLRRDKRSNEAAIKYLLLGAFSSGIFAYGLSLFYGLTGTTNNLIARFRLGERAAANLYDPIIILALVATAAGLFFKIAAVPFHQWAPDAYEGAPTSITGYMSVAGKAAAWALLLRIFLMMAPLRELYLPMVIFVAIATMTGGNLAALTQSNTKRLLAYSSIAHVGYMLLGLVAADAPDNNGIKGILVYLLVYTFMNLGAFGVITSLRRRNIIGDEIDDMNGLFQKAPVESLAMIVFLLSLAGIPPLAGFYGKYFIFLSLIQTGHYALASLAVIYVAVSLYYYLKIANAMLMRPALDTEPVRLSPGMTLGLAITAVATVYIGLNPEWFLLKADWALGITHTAMTSMLR